MARVQPFCGVCVQPPWAQAVCSVPYDVLNRAEARRLCAKHRDSFLHVTRPDAALHDEAAACPAELYQSGAKALAELMVKRALVEDAAPAYRTGRLCSN